LDLGTTGTVVVSDSPVTLSGKHTYGCIFDGTNLSVYYDGNLVGSIASSGNNASSNTPLTVGAAYSSFEPAFFVNGNLLFFKTKQLGKYWSLKMWKSANRTNQVADFDFCSPILDPTLGTIFMNSAPNGGDVLILQE
jgi:hypothetical protein